MLDDRLTPIHRKALERLEEDGFDEAIDLLRPLVERGDPVACHIALMAASETPDASKKAAWTTEFRSALIEMAGAGDAWAQYELSQRLRFGDMFDQDLQAAEDWLRRAAESGNGEAQHHLAEYMERELFGLVGAEDEIRKWRARALEQRYPEALYDAAVRVLDWDNPGPAIEILSAPELETFMPARDLLGQLRH